MASKLGREPASDPHDSAITLALARCGSVDRHIMLNGCVGASKRIDTLDASAGHRAEVNEEDLIIAVIDDVRKPALEDDELGIREVTLKDRIFQMFAVALQCLADTVEAFWLCDVISDDVFAPHVYLVVNSG